MTSRRIAPPLHFHAEGTNLIMLWLQDGTLTLTLHQSHRDDAHTVSLDVEQAQALYDSLDMATPGVKTDLWSLKQTNRGDPYREGLSLELPAHEGAEDYETGGSVFIEDYVIGYLRKAVLDGLNIHKPNPQAPVPDDMSM